MWAWAWDLQAGLAQASLHCGQTGAASGMQTCSFSEALSAVGSLGFFLTALHVEDPETLLALERAEVIARYQRLRPGRSQPGSRYGAGRITAQRGRHQEEQACPRQGLAKDQQHRLSGCSPRAGGTMPPAVPTVTSS